MENQRTYGVHLAAAFIKLKPILLMVFLQVGNAGFYILTMLCLNRGLSHYVLVVYRHAAATIAVAPFALIFERKLRPKMTLKIFLKIMALAWIEPVIDQNLYYVGMKYTSATFTSALYNIVPAITFIMAIILRLKTRILPCMPLGAIGTVSVFSLGNPGSTALPTLERVKLKSRHSQAKIVGTIVTMGGAMIMTLYKGPTLEMFSEKSSAHTETTTANVGTGQNFLVGALILLCSCVIWSGFFILQSITLKEYPATLSLTSLIVFLGMVQGAAVALVMEHDFKAWAIGFDSRLLAPVYSGIMGSAIAYYLQGVVMKEKGPVFVTAFNPLCMIVVAALGSLILAEQLHLGSVIGSIVIGMGLYSVIWGKSQDHTGSSPTLIIVPENTHSGVIKSETPTRTLMTDVPKTINLCHV